MATEEQEVFEALSALTNIPEEVHWLCDDTEYEDDRRESYRCPLNTEQRIEKTKTLLKIFAIDTHHTLPWLKSQLTKQLSRCSNCVETYHEMKRGMFIDMQRDYDLHDIEDYFRKLADWDVERLVPELERSEQLVRSLPPEKRRLNQLNKESLYAMYDVLCDPSLLKHQPLGRLFTYTFSSIQQKRSKLKVPNELPAMITFLFEEDQGLQDWAISTCKRQLPQVEPAVFEKKLLHSLVKAIRTVNDHAGDEQKMSRFFKGALHIIENASKEVINKSICGATWDLVKFATNHVADRASYLGDILLVMTELMRKLQYDFWDAVSPVSPTSFVDWVFKNPQVESVFMRVNGPSDPAEFRYKINNHLEWVEPFVGTLRLSNRSQASSSLLFHLLKKYQNTKFPILPSTMCLSEGMKVLQLSLVELSKEAISGTVDHIICRTAMDLVEGHITAIVNAATTPSPAREVDEVWEHVQREARTVLRSAIKVDCKVVYEDYQVLSKDKALPSVSVTRYSKDLYEGVTGHFVLNDVPFAIGVLGSLLDLVGLEKLKIQDDSPIRASKLEFNKTLCTLNTIVGELLNRVSEFDPDKLIQIITDENAGKLVIATLFSTENGYYLPGVDIIKQAYNTVGKVEGLRLMLTQHFDSAIGSFLWGIHRVKKMRTFGPMPALVKTCVYLLQILCDSQDGLVLTEGHFREENEKKKLRLFWTMQWELLGVIFEETIKFQKTQDRGALVEFTRDTMEYADQLFTAFPVFEQALAPSVPESAFEATSQIISKTGIELLQCGNKNLYKLASWLRLRDGPLLRLCHGLLCKILKQLESANIPVEEEALSRLLKFAMRSNLTKYMTNMTDQQKAELRAACGETTPEKVEPKKEEKKQTTLAQWTAPRTETERKIKREVIEIPDDEYHDLDDGFSHADMMAALELSKAPGKTKKVEPVQKPRIAPSSKSSSIPSRPKIPYGKMTAIEKAKADVAERVREKKEREAAEEAARAKGPNVGSNLAALKIVPKDPPKVAPKILEDTSSEEDESGDDDGKGLFALATKKKPQTVLLDNNRGHILRPGNFTLQKQARSAADVRARLTPDLSPLYRKILNWNFFHDSDFPPGTDEKAYSMVTNTFYDVADYRNTFEPLLMLESWNQFRKAKEEDNFTTFTIELATRMNADNFVELHMTMDQQEYLKLKLSFFESDVLLISTAQQPLASPNAPNCLARVIAVNRKKGQMDMSLRCLPSSDMLPNLRPKAKYQAVKILSLVPLEREYGALLSLTYYDLKDEIIKARPTQIKEAPEDRVRQLSKNYQLNDPQAKAVIAAMDNDGFTLIQGPPGSGKTKTVVGIVGGILSPLFKNVEGKISTPGGISNNAKVSSKKLLVCAPSNAAVDELVIRFKEGIKTLSGDHVTPNIIRLGRSDAINAAVRDVTIEELVDGRLAVHDASKTSASDNSADPVEMREEMNKLLAERAAIRLAKETARGNGESEKASELVTQERQLSDKIRIVGRRIDAQQDAQNTERRNHDIMRRKIQQEIMDESHIICATLSGAGHEMLKGVNVEFETVVIDEAAQSIELSALIPLKYGSAKCILVGDPKQLPPTVMSRDAARYMFEQSLFVRMQKNHPEDVHLLSIQYRMHPLISQFPSQEFYDSELRDGPDLDKLRKRPWHNSTIFGPYRFFDIQGQESSTARGHSLINATEVQVALAMYERLKTDYPDIDFNGMIGIITPYKQQLSELKRVFRNKYGEEILKTIDFNTTDAFQGREREIVIFSCVRASPSGGIGFLSDIRRMNVGLTRAKSSLWVLGSASSLLRNEFWGKLVRDARARGLYTDGNIKGMLSAPVRLGVRPKPVSLPIAMDIDVPTASRNYPQQDSNQRSSNLDNRMQPISRPEVAVDPRKRPMPDPRNEQGRYDQPPPGPSGPRTDNKTRPNSLPYMSDGPANLIPPNTVINDPGLDQKPVGSLCFQCGEFGHKWQDGCPNRANPKKVQHRKKYEMGDHHSRQIPAVQSSTDPVRPAIKRHPSNELGGPNKRFQKDGRVPTNPPYTKSSTGSSNNQQGDTYAAGGSMGAAPANKPSLPPVPPRRLPPPPRKKEADLFIRPKPKKPRPGEVVQPSMSDMRQRVKDGLFKKKEDLPPS